MRRSTCASIIHGVTIFVNDESIQTARKGCGYRQTMVMFLAYATLKCLVWEVSHWLNEDRLQRCIASQARLAWCTCLLLLIGDNATDEVGTGSVQVDHQLVQGFL